MPDGVDAFPHEEDQRPGIGWDQVPLMAPDTPASYAAWRQQMVDTALAAYPLPEGKKKIPAKLAKDREKAVEPYPADLVEAVQRDTAWWKQLRWSQPPGSRRVLYWRRQGALEVTTPIEPRRPAAPPVEMMLLALTTPSGRSSALPRIARTLPQGELVHRALVSQVGRGDRVDCPELTGKDERGEPLRGHRHTHVLHVDLDRDGRLDHVLLYAPMGLGPGAQHAIRRLRRTWTKGGVGELQLAIAGAGSLEDLRALPNPLAGGIEAILGPAGGARSWTSSTPFVPPRHLKRKGKDELAGQVQAELRVRGLPAAALELLPWDEAHLPLRHAIRVRRDPAKRPPADVGFALRLRFDEPVKGPLALGYGSHYGLGMFTAAPEL